MVTLADRTLLKDYDISYDETIKITFCMTPECGTYESFINSAAELYNKCISMCVSKKYGASIDGLTFTEFDTAIKNNKDEVAVGVLRRHYNIIQGALSFPYHIIRNNELVCLDEFNKDWLAKINSARNMYDMWLLLQKHKDTMNSEPYVAKRTVICKPNDVLFIVNYKRLESKWVELSGFEAGCYMDSAYVRKSGIDNRAEFLAFAFDTIPVYYCQLSEMLCGEHTIGFVKCLTKAWTGGLVDWDNSTLTKDAFRKIEMFSHKLFPKISKRFKWVGGLINEH